MGRFPFFFPPFIPFPPCGFLGLFLSDSILFYFPPAFCLLLFFIFLPLLPCRSNLNLEQKLFSFFSFHHHHSILFYSVVFLRGILGKRRIRGTWRNWREGTGMGWDGMGREGKEGRKEGRGKEDLFAKTKQTKKNNSNQKKKLFKSQNRDPKDLKKTIMHRGRESQSAIYNKQQSCSAVQCSPSYRAYVLRESSGLSRKGCEPRIPCSETFSYFSFAFLPPFFFPLFLSFFLSSQLSGLLLFCDLLLRSILHLHFVFLLRWRSGEVGNRGGGVGGCMGRWEHGTTVSRGVREEEEGRKITESKCSLFFSSIYIFIFSFPISQSQILHICFIGGSSFLFLFFFFTHFSDFLNLTFLARALKLKQCYHSCPHHFSS